MGRNVRDKLYKKNSKCKVERKNIIIIVFLPTFIYGCPFSQQLMFPSRLNK